MTQFFYGTILPDALTIAQRGAIVSPLVEKSFAWLNELSNKEKDYYDELVGRKQVIDLAHEIAKTELATGKEKENQYIFLVSSVTAAIVQARTRGTEPKIILGIDIDHERARFAKWPETIYLDKLVDVRLYEKATEHSTAIEKAFGKYTKCFYVVKSK